MMNKLNENVKRCVSLTGDRNNFKYRKSALQNFMKIIRSAKLKDVARRVEHRLLNSAPTLIISTE